MKSCQIECILVKDLADKKNIIKKYKNALYTLMTEESYYSATKDVIEKLNRDLERTVSHASIVLDYLNEVREYGTLNNRLVTEVSEAQFHRLYDNKLCINDTLESVTMEIENLFRNVGEVVCTL